jgi:flagellar biosynthesis protein FlhF
MKVKTFHALTMQDAMRAIKEELGPEAIILSSKEVRQGGRMLRLFNRPVLEVMAACEQDPPRAMPPPRDDTSESRARQLSGERAASPPAVQSFHETLRSALGPATAPAEAAVAEPVAPPKQPAGEEWKRHRLRHLRGELRELSRLLAESLPPETQSIGAQVPPPFARLCRSFVHQGMRPSTAEALGGDLLQRLGNDGLCDEEAVTRALQQAIARRVRVSGPVHSREGGRAVGLILGPSGSGKTSIVTKLAAHHRIELKQSVALVTFDAYREASVEQLRRYARALGVPFASARSPRQLYEGLRRHGRADVVLIDMPGVGPEDVASAGELHRLLGEESDMATHVVLPASAQERDLRGIIERVKALPSLHILFTKLDETESFGIIVDLARYTGLPLSYWGVGQRVPEDIELASPERLAEFLMARRYVASRASLSQQHMLLRTAFVPQAVGAGSESNEWEEESSCRAR